MTQDEEKTGTQIDLGDDLIERTAMIPGVVAPAAKPSEETIDDKLETARILAAEGMLEEAKQTLHAVLREDPGNVLARVRLTEIHDLELKNIFEGTPKRKQRVPHPSPDKAVEDSEAIARQLDLDLGLGIFHESDPAISIKIAEPQPALGTQDQLDVGIAFLQMEQPHAAIDCLKNAARKITSEDPNAWKFRNSVTCLLAQALLEAGRPFEAVLELDSVLSDLEIPPPEKAEALYWIARAQERAGNKQIAIEWFEKLAALKPSYRDVEDRLNRLYA